MAFCLWYLKLEDKELGDLSAVYQSTDQSVKFMCCRQDRLEGPMIEMNDKYGSLVTMMAKMNGGNGKGMQMEGHMTPILSGGGAKISGARNLSTQGNGKDYVKLLEDVAIFKTDRDADQRMNSQTESKPLEEKLKTMISLTLK
ncbi:Hypothetical predicted protein [Olea europaea subsp. europaea]|uniref:Uncharacterized protein n=1 Tax=Olea europaea subsp. europaea TaxID=158383 RepID=A0A8S0UFL2_OLEEU|nr:Hypothetical predicted protein [Olea europaea subsp. europaea]